jgi:hypothetical protein
MKARFEGKCPACDRTIHKGDPIVRRGSQWIHASHTREDREYMAGKNEVAEIQAISAPGSALREQLYLEMEQAAYNRGEEY